MDLNLTVLRLASGLAAHATVRQTVISQNVANADTPGYRARDVTDFASQVDGGGMAFSARLTRPGHVPFGPGATGQEVRETSALGAETPNGNTVALEDQIMRAAQVKQSHDMAIGVYQKSLDILRMSLGRR
jgi:flagellar basal-body rod protein FlgB